MQLFGDTYFFIIAGLLAVPAVVFGVKEKPINIYGFCVTLFFIIMTMKSRPSAIVWMAVYVALQYVLVRTYLSVCVKYGRNRGLYWLYIFLAVAPLAVFKITGLTGHSLFGFMGISYMTFKSVQMIIEEYDMIIKEVDPFEFVYFLLFFPCVLSGPIDRSRRFHEDFTTVHPKQEYLDMVGTGLFKIVLGAAYKFAAGSLIYQLMIWYGLKSTFTSHLIYMYCYGFYLFFDFAGYTLMAVGMSYIYGIRSPENFNKPFLALDMKDFWDRWHISLSHWFRDFIFSRLMMRSIKGKWFKSKLTGASFGLIVNMTVMGVWHGFDIYYIMYGVYHGVLLALTEIYQKKCRNFHRAHKNEKWYIAVSWFITFNLVMFGFFIFSGRFTQILGISW